MEGLNGVYVSMLSLFLRELQSPGHVGQKGPSFAPARIKWDIFWQGTFPDKMRISTEKTT